MGDICGVTEDPDRSSRRTLLRRGAAVSGALAVGVMLWEGRPLLAASPPSAEQDEDILNFALGLEYLQAQFYTDALERGTLGGELHEFANVVGDQEQQHVGYLRDYLGSAARDEPTFDFGELLVEPASFRNAALTLEHYGVGAYVGQGANLTVDGVAAAAPIISVEARHAAWIRAIAGRNPAPAPADPAIAPERVLSALAESGLPVPT
jgi:hypothetical protein